MNQEAKSEGNQYVKPLNSRQLAFARELGVALARGGKDAHLVEAYTAAGYKENRGNARRMASDPRIWRIAEKACREALRISGLHIGYLQAKALQLLRTSPMEPYRAVAKCLDEDGNLRADLTVDEIAELDAATWALSKLRIGNLSVEIADKKSLIEMLSKQLGFGKEGTEINLSWQQLIEQSLDASAKEST